MVRITGTFRFVGVALTPVHRQDLLSRYEILKRNAALVLD
jgi:hypothetical protein